MKPGTILFLAVLVVIGYAGMLFLKPVINNFRLKDAMEQQARVGTVEPDSTIGRVLAEKAAAWGIPLAKEDFVAGIDRSTPGEVTIAVSYEVEVALPSFKHTLRFNPRVTVQPMVTER
jgi:hypothetical protein